MAEEKLNTGQGEQITMDETVTPVDPGPDKETPTTPEQDGPAQPEVGDVALNNEAEVAVPGEEAKEPEAPTPGTEEKAPEATTPEADTRPENVEQKPLHRGRPPQEQRGAGGR